MADPITAAVIVGLMASKFAEGVAGKGAEKLVEQLWGAIATRFKGRKKAEEALAQLEASQGQAPEAQANLVRVLDGDLFEDDVFRKQIEAIVQQIREADPEREATISVVIHSSGANAVNTGQNQGTINYGKV